MVRSLWVAVLGLSLLAGCGSGGPKGTFDRAMGRGKKDKSFVADLSRLQGAYILNSVGQWEGSKGTAYTVSWKIAKETVEPRMMLYIKDGSIEIASRTDFPLKTCSVSQAITQGPGNNIEIAATEGCEASSMAIIQQQDSSGFIVTMAPFACPRLQTGMCTGLEFKGVPDWDVGELMYGWPADLATRMAPTIKSLQYPDVAASALEPVRAAFKGELTAVSVSLRQDLALTQESGFPAGYGALVANGQVFPRDELIAKVIGQVGSFDTLCEVISQSKPSIQKFQRKLANLEVIHSNRAEGRWVYSQLHEGLGNVVTAEQKRAPSENKFPTTEMKNSVSFTVEAAESEKNGNDIMSDHDIQFTCSKNLRAGPISMEDIKRALGDVVTFAK